MPRPSIKTPGNPEYTEQTDKPRVLNWLSMAVEWQDPHRIRNAGHQAKILLGEDSDILEIMNGGSLSVGACETVVDPRDLLRLGLFVSSFAPQWDIGHRTQFGMTRFSEQRLEALEETGPGGSGEYSSDRYLAYMLLRPDLDPSPIKDRIRSIMEGHLNLQITGVEQDLSGFLRHHKRSNDRLKKSLSAIYHRAIAEQEANMRPEEIFVRSFETASGGIPQTPNEVFRVARWFNFPLKEVIRITQRLSLAAPEKMGQWKASKGYKTSLSIINQVLGHLKATYSLNVTEQLALDELLTEYLYAKAVLEQELHHDPIHGVTLGNASRPSEIPAMIGMEDLKNFKLQGSTAAAIAATLPTLLN